MNVSLKWAQSVSNVDILSLPKEDLIKKIGLQLGAIESVTDYGTRFDKALVVRVVSCDDHPNADRLHVCRIDDGGVTQEIERGDDGFIQVVCGAPNVREGLSVVWLPPGSTVPASLDDKEPFVLGARELRGVLSNGMLASAKELGLSNDHDGILEIHEDVAAGTPFATLYDLDDTIVDCENKMFTHRPDCFGILGVARELAGIQNLQFQSPEWYRSEPNFESVDRLPLNVLVETGLVPRFVAVAMDAVSIAPSPVWMQSALARVGIKSINNVVDITNYVMHLTGQPLHAYDYDKVASRSGDVPTLVGRMGRDGEKLALLNGKTIELTPDSIVIATDKEAVGLAGAMGGADTEVDETTTKIILEVATFDMYSIRRTSMKYGVFTDAVTRFNKGQSPEQNSRVLAYAMELLSELAQASQASEVKDIRKTEPVVSSLSVGVGFINERLGSSLSADEIAQLLRNVEFTVNVEGDRLEFAAPFWRQDIELPEDIVEEVGRLYGFNKLPIELPHRSVAPVSLEHVLALKKKLRTVMASAGASEVLTYNFVHGKLLERAGQSPSEAFRLRNALSPELQYYRLSLIPGLLQLIHPNIKAGSEEFMIYELGKSHNKNQLNEEGLPQEFNAFAGIYASKASKVTGFYQVRKYLDFVADQFGVVFEYVPVGDMDSSVLKPFEPLRSALVKVRGREVVLGVVGEFKTDVTKNFKLPGCVAGFEIGLIDLLDVASSRRSYSPLSRFPGTTQDICFKVATSTTYAALASAIAEVLSGEVIDTTYELIDIYQGEDTTSKQLTFRVSLTDHSKTLTGDEASLIIKKVTDVVTQKLSAVVI